MPLAAHAVRRGGLSWTSRFPIPGTPRPIAALQAPSGKTIMRSLVSGPRATARAWPARTGTGSAPEVGKVVHVLISSSRGLVRVSREAGPIWRSWSARAARRPRGVRRAGRAVPADGLRDRPAPAGQRERRARADPGGVPARSRADRPASRARAVCGLAAAGRGADGDQPRHAQAVSTLCRGGRARGCLASRRTSRSTS